MRPEIRPGLKWIFVVALPLLLVIRTLFFVYSFGSVEHDSGWFAGVARNIAERGIYASFSNTIESNEVGIQRSIHNRPSLQDEQGFVYFPAGVSVGPGYQFPQAFFFKLFGVSRISAALWPLICFCILIFILFWIAYRSAGLISVIILFIWLYLIPQLYVQFSYEAFSEHIAIMYLLLSIVVFSYVETKKFRQHRFFLYLVSGIFLGLAILTKLLISVSALAFPLYFLYKLIRRKFSVNYVLLSASTLVTVGLYALYRAVSIVHLFGWEGLHAANEDFTLHFHSAGSGIDELLNRPLNIDQILGSFGIWWHVGLGPTTGIQQILPWIVLLIGSYLLLKDRQTNVQLRLLLVSASLNLGYFIIVSPIHFLRHAYLGVIVLVLVSSIIAERIFIRKKILSGILVIAALFCLLLGPKEVLHPNLFLNGKDLQGMLDTKKHGIIFGYPSLILVPLKDQSEVMSFLKQNPGDNIFYKKGFMVAELSMLLGKVFYPEARADQFSGNKILIIGPYQRGKFAIQNQSCDDPIFENASYQVCRI